MVVDDDEFTQEKKAHLISRGRNVQNAKLAHLILRGRNVQNAKLEWEITHSTVKLVHSSHPQLRPKVAAMDRWPLYKGYRILLKKNNI